MRVFGGMYFGRLSDIYGRRPVIIICSSFLTVIMFISAILPSDYTLLEGMDVSTPAVFFVMTRLLIGLFVGGLWPTTAILAMENLYWDKFKNENTEMQTKLRKNINDREWEKWENTWKRWNIRFEDRVKRLTFQSSILQVGLFIGYLVSALLVIYHGHFNFLTSIPQYNDFPLWRSMSLIAGCIGLVLSFLCGKYLNESEKWKEWKAGWKKWLEWNARKGRKEKEGAKGKKGLEGKKQTPGEFYMPGITSLLEVRRKTLFSFWLIMTGIMYMYYSTIVTAPELFLRDTISSPFFFVIFLFMMALAHFWVGILCRTVWKRPSGFLYRIFFSLDFINTLKNLFPNLIGVDHKNNNYNNNDMIDVMLITKIGFILVPIGFFVGILFYKIQPESDAVSAALSLIFTSLVILVANAAWALIPSMLSSRFPIHLRSTGASLAYNGGLVISFASPFIIIEYYLEFKSEYVIFVAMILGAVSMIVGGLKLIKAEKEKLFWKSYEKLELEEIEQSHDNRVNGQHLKKCLLSRMNDDEAYRMIKDMATAGKIYKVGEDVYKRSDS
jgi:MFS family permease